ncbi:MAG: prenyltransferase [Bdellovibrio sp.]|nr:prenyltransferase [Bdellovibrio sp.]
MRSHRFISVKKADPLFSQYLLGKTADGLRPIPVETFNLGSPEETVTFEMLEQKEIQRPSVFEFVSRLIKLPTFLLILMPLFFVFTKNFVDDRFRDPFCIVLAAFAMLFLFAGLNIRNDVVDHLSGFDRVNIAFTAKPIMSGWVTAWKAAHISWILIGISFLISLPIFILQIELFRILVVVIVLLVVSQFFEKNSYKQNWLGEWTLFLLLGPALVSGYQVSLGAGIDTEGLAFGVLWGFACLFLIHVNNFSHMLTSSQAQIKNTMTKMGFDKAKKFLIAWWTTYFVLWFLFHWFYGGMFWTLFGTALLVFWSLPLFLKVAKIQSPIGSSLKEIRRESLKTFLMMVAILVVENLWYIGVKLDWTL